MQKDVYEFISKYISDPIVEWKTCTVSGQPFAIFQSDVDFYDRVSPTFDGKKFAIPTPTRCPEERERRRLLFRNVHKLYKSTSSSSGKSIISPFSLEKGYNVVSAADWFGDNDSVEGLAYGLDIDVAKQNVLSTFAVLQKIAPRWGSYITNSENCERTTNTDNSKNSYLSAATVNSENIYYCDTSFDSNNIVDSLMSHGSSNCYGNVDCNNAYKVYDSVSTE